MEDRIITLDEAHLLVEQFNTLHPDKDSILVIATDAARHSKDLDLVQAADLKLLEVSKPEVKTVAPYLKKVNRQKRNLRRL